jgi:hypothetical protein
MSFKIDIHPSDTLRIIFSGIVTGEELKSVRENAKAMVRANKLKNIYCDLRGAFLDIKQIELFNYAATNKKIYKGISKTAIIYSKGKHNLEDLNLYANAANSRGFKIRLFNNGSEASKWLKF